ncbi:hypothetical protein F3Y22_tig00005294pilonHSYRG00171 [Hibiscus syriacus]|uniref:Integrase catalytic domain-containing protein n=1 Tax=Hibiscus syriacus TaxID=106335 RepID=A0A6A3CGK4_HIBSY|nr:hypothetical protein F3Y22_tig00005294pilonHSYRG00171 [Hibiscus syriacus]
MKIDDELQALILLSSLPKSWVTLVITLSNSAPEGKLTMDIVSDSLLGEESRRMERGKSIHPEANITENRGRNETRGRNKSRDPHQSRDRSKKSRQDQDRRDKTHIILTTSTGCKLILKDVRHVPAMCFNLISAEKLDDASLINYFGEGKWKLTKGSLIMTRGKKERSLYVMQAKLCKGEVNITAEDVELWHKRLGHISEKGLHMLARTQLLHDVKDLVHTDVCSMSERSIGGALYFVTFIDDQSRKVCVHLLKSNDQVLDAFKEFHALMEREIRRKIKCRTPPKTPQLNGLVERMNITIDERVRCVLSHVKLPKSFCGEAIMVVVDIVNLTPSVPLNRGIPKEGWTGKRASYNHLKISNSTEPGRSLRDRRSSTWYNTDEYVMLTDEGEPQSYKEAMAIKREKSLEESRPKMAAQSLDIKLSWSSKVIPTKKFEDCCQGVSLLLPPN